MADDVLVTINGNTMGLLAALDAGATALTDFGATAEATSAQTDAASASTADMGAAATATAPSLANLGAVTNDAGGKANLFQRAVGGVLEPLQAMGDQIMHVAETMLLWRSIDWMIGEVQSLDEGLFGLNNTMERMQTSWKYLFGTGNNSASTAIAQSLADWTKTFSIDLPFTRQDLLGGVNSLASVENNPDLIKKYMPDIADLASTRTNFAGQPLTMQQASYSLVTASEGMTRMLKYDLKLNPDELKKYGWDEKSHNFANLLEAIHKYNEAHHITGAAKDMAHSTFFGEFSSFQDRLQNWELGAGSAMFKGVKGDLESLNAWIDANQKSLTKLGETFGGALASGVHVATGAIKDFVSGWQNGGLGQFVANPWYTSQADTYTAKANAEDKAGNHKQATKDRAQAAYMRQQAQTHGTRQDTVGSELGGIGADVMGIGQNLFGGLLGGLSQSDALGGVRDILRDIRDILGSPLLKQGAGALGTVAGLAVGEGLHTLAAVLGVVAGLVDWLSSHPKVAEALLLTLAGVIINNVVVALVAWAAAMIPVVIEFIILEWPILLIIALIALLVLGIIELVAHWSQITTQLGKWKDQFLNWAGGLITNFKDWGTHMIQNFLAGAVDKWNDFKKWLSTAGTDIKNIFGHTKPKEGPLADDDVWMVHMMDNFSAGIIAGTPRVVAASRAAAAAIQGEFGGVQGSGAPGVAGSAASYATTVGDSATTHNWYGVNEAVMRRVAREEVVANSRRVRAAIATPGGYGRPGYGV